MKQKVKSKQEKFKNKYLSKKTWHISIDEVDRHLAEQFANEPQCIKTSNHKESNIKAS
jgi:hypothetical protein